MTEDSMSKTVMITGAGSGFGKAASIALAERGHHVIATTETDAHVEELRAEAPELQVERIDITNAQDIEKIAGWEVDVLINNAGVGQTGPLADVPMERVRRTFEVNVFGTLAVTQAVIKGMATRGSGRIIIVSSIAGVAVAPTFGPYAMTKHALQAMGKAMRAELAPMEDRGVVLASINGPDGATLSYTRRYAEAIERMGQDIPEMDRIFTIVGNPSVAQGSVIMRGKSWEERDRTTMDMAPKAIRPPTSAVCRHWAALGQGRP